MTRNQSALETSAESFHFSDLSASSLAAPTVISVTSAEIESPSPEVHVKIEPLDAGLESSPPKERPILNIPPLPAGWEVYWDDMLRNREMVKHYLAKVFQQLEKSEKPRNEVDKKKLWILSELRFAGPKKKPQTNEEVYHRQREAMNAAGFAGKQH